MSFRSALIALTGDILLAHAANSFRNRWEYLPVWFSPLAAAGLAVGCACARGRSASGSGRF
jgi:hypothetical protein